MANEVINVGVAQDKVLNMYTIATNINDIFDNVYKEICKIGDSNTYDSPKARALRESLELFSKDFSDVYAQIKKDAETIRETAETYENL